MKNTAYYKMLEAYQRNEEQYVLWTEQRRLFEQRCKERYYYRKGVNRERRKKLAEAVLKDFPRASWREVCSQTGGCREIIWEFGLWETPHDPYWLDGPGKWEIFQRLRLYPDEIYDAIETPYEWSQTVRVRTTLVEKYIPEILDDIGRGRV